MVKYLFIHQMLREYAGTNFLTNYFRTLWLFKKNNN